MSEDKRTAFERLERLEERQEHLARRLASVESTLTDLHHRLGRVERRVR